MSEALPEAAPDMPHATLELALAPEDVAGLLRRAPGSRPERAVLVWHDTAAGELTADNLALCEEAGAWRLERLRPDPARPGVPPPALARGDGADALGLSLSGPLTPIAAWQGTRRALQLASEGAVEAELLEGRLHGVAAEAALCRVLLRGPPDALGPAASELARTVQLSVPLDGMAAEAIRFARGTAPAPRLGAPDVPASVSVADAVAAVLGHLAAVLLHWSGPAATGELPEAVHQMRVATRRLRSALSVFRAPAACPEIEALQPRLRNLATRLGAARDWDVFLHGAGRAALDAVEGDGRVAATLAAARRRRHAAYGELREMLAGPDWRELQVALACAAAFRPWERTEEGERLQTLRQPLAEYGAAVLARRHKRVRKGAKGMRTLPIEALHELRKSCKKLRYAAEIMRPQFPGRDAHRFDKRLAALQEALGMLNDGAVARGLMAELGRSGRGFGAGVVTGFAAAQSGDARCDIRRAWRRFRGVPMFWP